MARYKKKPVVIEAIQWRGFNNTSLTQVVAYEGDETTFGIMGRCQHCQMPIGKHGWIETLEGGHIVCPMDWIIQGVQGEFYPCKPDIFEATYELVE